MAWRKSRGTSRRAVWLRRGALSLLVVAALAVTASFFVDEPIRRLLVRQMNRSLKGYTATIRSASFHPIGLSLTLHDLSFTQNAHPDPLRRRVEQVRANRHAGDEYDVSNDIYPERHRTSPKRIRPQCTRLVSPALCASTHMLMKRDR